MDSFGSISAFPARQYLAATAVQAKGLNALVNDPGAALRRLGEQSLTAEVQRAERAERPPVIASASERALTGAMVRQSIDAAREKAAGKTEKPEEAAARKEESRGPGQLSSEEEKMVQDLKARDREVRAHEQAHKAVGGRYAGAISYSYQRGPDGGQYAIGGEVPIDMSPEATPEETIAKMRVVIAAALAPAEPSGADRSVAQAAQGQLVQAQADARAVRQEEAKVLREEAAAQEEAKAAARETQAVDHERPLPADLLEEPAIFAFNDPGNPYKALDAIDLAEEARG